MGWPPEGYLDASVIWGREVWVLKGHECGAVGEAVEDTCGVADVPEEGFATGAGGGDVGTAGAAYIVH